MASFSLEEVVQATGGEILHASSSVRIRGMCTDSRRIRPRELFVALSGPHFDGHGFVRQALMEGAVGAMVNVTVWPSLAPVIRRLRRSLPPHQPLIIGVNDPLVAYQQVAAFHRRKFSIPIVAVTGSNGKTTTKDMVGHILAGRWRLLKTEGNMNNCIGVPQTVLRLHRRHEVAVIEMGVDQVAQTTQLCAIAQPTCGMITNVGPDHLEFFGSLTASAQAKAELLACLPNDGVIVLNADDEFYKPFAQQASCPVVSYGFSHQADLRASDVASNQDGTTFRLHLPSRTRSVKVSMKVLGHHNVSNALASAAMGYAMGLSSRELASGLARFRPASMRTQIRKWKGVTVLWDCYNANPASMKAAITLLAELGSQKRTIAILGDMRELGKKEQAFHREIGQWVARQGIAYFIACGTFRSCFIQGAREGGMDHSRMVSVDTIDQAARAFKRLARVGDVVLLKASRGVRIERVLEPMGDQEQA